MKRALKILTNKYILTLAVFAIIMLFVDQHDWFTMQARENKLEEVNQNIQFVKDEIENMETQLNAIENDPATLERINRERYFGKRMDEDVYIIKKDTTN